jgi:hypothetical protein
MGSLLGALSATERGFGPRQSGPAADRGPASPCIRPRIREIRISADPCINRGGMIVGDSKNGAFIYENGTMRLLKRLSARFASDVNDSGDVVGLLETVTPGSPHTDKGFLFSDNALIELGTMDGDPESQTVQLRINNRRQISGILQRDEIRRAGISVGERRVRRSGNTARRLLLRDGPERPRARRRVLRLVSVRLSRRRDDRP